MADLSKIQIKQQGKASQIKPKQFGSTVGGEKKSVTLNFSTKQSSFSAPLKGSALTASLEKAGDKKQDPSVTETKTEAAGAKTDNYALHNTLKTRLNRLDSSLFSAQRGGGITAGAGDSLHFYSSQSTASASNIKQAQSYIGQATSYKKEADKCMAKGDYDGAIAAYKKAENSLKVLKVNFFSC